MGSGFRLHRRVFYTQTPYLSQVFGESRTNTRNVVPQKNLSTSTKQDSWGSDMLLNMGPEQRIPYFNLSIPCPHNYLEVHGT